MTISAIVSVGPNMEIGAGGKLLYPSPIDMAFFCGYTQEKILLMGRKTADTIKSPLPGRRVVCVTKNPREAFKNKFVNMTWDGVDFSMISSLAQHNDIVVVGGGEIYRMFEFAYNSVYVTHNATPYDGRFGEADTFFPKEVIDQFPFKTKIMSNKSENFEIFRYSR